MNAHTVVGRVAPRGAVARPAEWAPFVRPAARSAAIRRTGVGAGRAAAPRGDRTRPPRRHTVHEQSELEKFVRLVGRGAVEQSPRAECSASSAGCARATWSWGAVRKGGSPPPSHLALDGGAGG